jgi:hypothetical protein
MKKKIWKANERRMSMISFLTGFGYGAKYYCKFVGNDKMIEQESSVALLCEKSLVLELRVNVAGNPI